ncbi:eukaryotic translation initiation factor 4E type 2 [Chrysoperla carnea]|uniref:eukaryotic translation initiation factor 4E type 2 n=1 Tax=Chrysoperla carnea TaxID=189513 RepID=UPI001D06356A|nr:eukaryotic translation initiation factor 4E type 2 [Chrysoperla carnea]
MSNKFEALKEHGADSTDSGSGDDLDVNTVNNTQDLAPLEIPPNEHRLQHTYWLWYSKKPSSLRYSQALQLVGRVATVEQWWALYSHMIRLNDLPCHTDLHLFKEGIQPMWEDAANAKGGKWVVRLRKGQVGRAWENLCMAMLGEQFMVGNEICGAVVSVRYPDDMVSVWNRTASDQACTARIRDTLRRILNLPPAVPMDYKTHGDSLKDSLKAWKTNPIVKS